MKQKTVLGTVLLALGLVVVASSLPASHRMSQDEMASVLGGVCKATCKSNQLCGGEAAVCDGNCTGADQGTKCGHDKLDTSTIWYCGPLIENGGGCNLSGQTSKAGKTCKCDSEQKCKDLVAEFCNYYASCATD